MLIADAVQAKNETRPPELVRFPKSYELGLLPDKFELMWEQGIMHYVEEFVNWLGGYKVNRGATSTPIEVKAYFVQSMKQYAAMLLPLRNDQSDIPIVSVSIAGMAQDLKRYVPHAHNAYGYAFARSVSPDGKTISMKDADYPVDLNMKATMWGKNYTDMWQWNYYLMKQFHHGGQGYYIVDGNLTRMELTGQADSSELEAGESKERTLRWDYSVTLKAWMTEPSHDVKTVWDIPLTVIDGGDNYLDKYGGDVVSPAVANKE